jgi:hypothetical protein
MPTTPIPDFIADRPVFAALKAAGYGDGVPISLTALWHAGGAPEEATPASGSSVGSNGSGSNPRTSA